MKFGSFPIALAAMVLAGPLTWAEPARAGGGSFHVTHSRGGYSVVVGGSGVRFVGPHYRDSHDRFDRYDRYDKYDRHDHWQDRRTWGRDDRWHARRPDVPVRRVYRRGYRDGYDEGYDDGYTQARQDTRERVRVWRQQQQRTRVWYPDSTGQTAGSCTPTVQRRVIIWP